MPPLPEPLYPAEAQLSAAWLSGTACVLGDGNLPEDPTDQARLIRGEFLARLLRITRGGSASLPLPLTGAVVEGTPDLSEETSVRYLFATNCIFRHPILLGGAKLNLIRLTGCRLEGVMAHGLTVTSDTVIQNCDFDGPLHVATAHFGGKFLLDRCCLRAKDERIFIASGARFGGGVDLTDSSGAGLMSFMDAVFDAHLSFRNLRVSEHSPVSGLSCHGIKVASYFKISGAETDICSLHLDSAKINILEGDLSLWPAVVTYYQLDGMTYEHLAAHAVPGIHEAIAWVRKGASSFSGFCSQPWRELARAFRESGDDSAARRVLMEREKYYIAHEQSRMRARYDAARSYDGHKGLRFLHQCLRADCLWAELQVHCLWSGLKRLFIGYGYDPKRPLYWSAIFLALGWGLSFWGWHLGLFAPASDQILTSPDWLAAVALDPVAPTAHWLASPSAQHYEEFSPFLFALDTYLPVMDLGQESTWAVTTVTRAGWWGRGIWVMIQTAGWVVTSLGIAAVAGLVQKGRND